MTRARSPARRIVPLLGLLAAASLVWGCHLDPWDPGPPGAQGGPASVSGKIQADSIPRDAKIEVYREAGGAATPLSGTAAVPDRLGRFSTPPLVPGRYLIVLRTRYGPPSTASAVVPGLTDVSIRLATPGQGATVTLVAPKATDHSITCRLAPDESADPVPDRREVTLAPGQELRLLGLKPGLWHVDVLPDGATADFEVPADDAVLRWVMEPKPSPASGAVLTGRVTLPDGAPAVGASVTARVCSEDGRTIESWGRVAPVEPSGTYRLERLPPGPVYVRVEPRDLRLTMRPQPELVRISPSEPSTRDYSIRP